MAVSGNDFLGFLLWPGLQLLQEQNIQHEEALSRKAQAEDAAKFFETLSNEIKNANASTFQKKILPTFKDPKGVGTPRLHYAIEQLGNLKKDKDLYKKSRVLAEATLKELISIESDAISQRNIPQQTSLHLLAMYGTVELVAHLFTHFGLFIGLSQRNNHEEAESTLINAQDAEGRTALHFAACRSTEDIAKLLLDKKADPHVFDTHKEIPLHYAAKYCTPAVICLHKNTDPKKKDSQIWEKAFNKPIKSRGKNLVVWDLNPDYCLVATPIKKYYEQFLDLKNAENFLTLLQKAQEQEALRYTIVALPPFFEQALAHYPHIMKKIISEEKKGKLASLALRNSTFIKMLCEEKGLTQLILLSKEYPKFAREFFDYHISRLTKENKKHYLNALYQHYNAPERNFEALYKAINNTAFLNKTASLADARRSIRSINDFKEFFSNIPDFLRERFQKATPLHIAAKYSTVESIQALLDLKSNWCNKLHKNKSPLDIAIQTDKPNIEVIELLYNSTTAAKIFTAYLPKYLIDSLQHELLPDETKASKFVLENHPYHLTHVLIHSECRKKYSRLKAMISNSDNLLNAFGKDPLLMLVAFKLPIFTQHIEKILTNMKSLNTLFKHVDTHQKDIGFHNAQQLALSTLKQGLILQENITNRITFLEAILEKWGNVFPQITLDVLKGQHKDLITKERLKTMIKAYIPAYHLNMLPIKISDETQLDEIKLLESYKKTLLEGLQSLTETHLKQIKAESEYTQLQENNTKEPTKCITVVQNMVEATDTITEGLGIHTKNLNATLGEKKTFLELLKELEKNYKPLSKFTNSRQAKWQGHPYKAYGGNTFLHVAAARGNRAISMVEHCLKNEKLKTFLEEFCNDKNSTGKSPLEIALAAKNVPAIEVLAEYTTDSTIWQKAFNTPIEVQNKAATLKAQINKYKGEEFWRIAKGYRLLNNKYREAFKACIKIITSLEKPNKHAQEFDELIKDNIYAACAIIDCPRLFTYLLSCSDIRPIVNLFLEYCQAPLSPQGTFISPLEDEKFYNALQGSKHLQEIVIGLAEVYDITHQDIQKIQNKKDMPDREDINSALLRLKTEFAQNLEIASKNLVTNNQYRVS